MHVNGQLACWLKQLEEYDFDIFLYIGKLHNNTDTLSPLFHWRYTL